MKKLVEDCKDHSYAFLNRTFYQDITHKEYLLEVYCCVDCGTGMHIYTPLEEIELPT